MDGEQLEMSTTTLQSQPNITVSENTIQPTNTTENDTSQPTTITADTEMKTNNEPTTQPAQTTSAIQVDTTASTAPISTFNPDDWTTVELILVAEAVAKVKQKGQTTTDSSQPQNQHPHFDVQTFDWLQVANVVTEKEYRISGSSFYTAEQCKKKFIDLMNQGGKVKELDIIIYELRKARAQELEKDTLLATEKVAQLEKEIQTAQTAPLPTASPQDISATPFPVSATSHPSVSGVVTVKLENMSGLPPPSPYRTIPQSPAIQYPSGNLPPVISGVSGVGGRVGGLMSPMASPAPQIYQPAAFSPITTPRSPAAALSALSSVQSIPRPPSPTAPPASKEDLLHIVDNLIEHNDSVPFRQPVSAEEAPCKCDVMRLFCLLE